VMTRLIVLPFRTLRPDADTDFLTFSLPDAIASSLSGLDALVVRSSLVAARFAGETPDLKRIAADADVDVVLTGTLLRAGEQLRVSTQLVEAPAGTLLWSQTSQVTLRDIFQLQDDLVQRIVEALSLPLTAREHRLLRHDVPASPTAYEFYLRANQLIQQVGLDAGEQFALARDLYLARDEQRQAAAARERQLCAHQRPDPRVLRAPEEARRTREPVAVHERHGRVAQLDRAPHEVFGQGRAPQEGKGRSGMEFHVHVAGSLSRSDFRLLFAIMSRPGLENQPPIGKNWGNGHEAENSGDSQGAPRATAHSSGRYGAVLLTVVSAASVGAVILAVAEVSPLNPGCRVQSAGSGPSWSRRPRPRRPTGAWPCTLEANAHGIERRRVGV